MVDAVYKYNQLRTYPLTDVQIMEWAEHIERLMPDYDIKALHWFIDQMFIGKYPHSDKGGIQNLFIGLQKIERVGDKFQFKVTWESLGL